MKKRLAKYGIFSSENGADFLLYARDEKGKPFMKYEDAVKRLNSLTEKHKLFIRKV